MKKNNLLCFGLGLYQEKLALSSKKYQNYNVVIEHKKNLIKKNQILIDKLILGSVYKYQSAINYYKKINFLFNITDIIFRSSGPAILTAYKIYKKLKIKRISKDLAHSVYSKNFFFNFLKKKKIISDKKVRLTDLKFNKNKEYIIKPDAPIIGKKGVLKTDKIDKRKNKLIESLSDNKKINITKFIEGEDISIVIFKNKKDKKIKILNYLKEINFIKKNSFLKNKAIIGYYSLDNIEIQNRVLDISNEIIKYFKQYYGFLIISYRVNKTQIFPYEINVGMGGDNYAEMIFPFFYKNNIYDLEILNLMGSNNRLIRKKKNKFIGIINNEKFHSKKIFFKELND